MEITGTKNLGLLKRALLGHITYCSIKATRVSDKDSNEVWDPEIKDTQELLAAVDINLRREEEATAGFTPHPPQGGA